MCGGKYYYICICIVGGPDYHATPDVLLNDDPIN